MKTSPFWHKMAAMSMMSCLFVRNPQLIVASSFVHVVPMKDALLPLSAGEIISSSPFGAADPVASPDSFCASDWFGRADPFAADPFAADPLVASCPLAAAVPCAGRLTAENGAATAC